MHILLWIVQALLGLLFMFAGAMKLITPIAQMTQQMEMPGPFLRFLGVAEILGGLGLILPGLLHIKTWLTPLAAACLACIMIGATVITLRIGPPVMAGIPVATGALATWIAYSRWRMAPLK